MSRLNWEEVERLRRMVPERTDWHLANWARWTMRYREVRGFGRQSLGFDGAGTTSFEDVEEQVDGWAANLADAVVDTISIDSRNAIAAVYCGGAWRLRADLLPSTLVEAAELFEQRARRKGLT